MGHLFLDIETYAAANAPETALNPYLAGSKALLIAYNYYPGQRPPVKRDIKEPVLLMEWLGGEETMLRRFLGFLQQLRQSDRELRIHGFNILNFDLPYLFGRMKHHQLADDSSLHAALFGAAGTDMMQLALAVSSNQREKEQLWDMNQAAVNAFFGLQTIEGTAQDCSRLYDEGNYDALADRCRQEFVLEQLLNSFYLYLDRLQEGSEMK